MNKQYNHEPIQYRQQNLTALTPTTFAARRAARTARLQEALKELY
ncbi:hypothetical protein ACT691_02150 [Vibrio metschnikovii]